MRRTCVGGYLLQTYGLEGVKAAWFKRTLPMDKVIDSLISNPGEPEEKIIFRTANSIQTQGPVLRSKLPSYVQ